MATGTASRTGDPTAALYKILREWDGGSSLSRMRILRQFVALNQNKTGAELESQLCDGASLFFARLTAWFRLTYMHGTCLVDQLRAINVFLSAASGHTFVTELMEVGCIQTLLELLALKQAREIDKLEALKVLYTVADCGRKYKEFICESYGIRTVAECIATSSNELTCEEGRRLLHCLAEGNPRFRMNAYKAFVALLSCDCPIIQRMAAMTVHRLQPSLGDVNFNVIDPVVGLLRSLNVEVQVEAGELICELIKYESLKDRLLDTLVQLLTPSDDEIERAKFQILQDPSVPALTKPLAVYVQQSGAARCLGRLVRQSPDIVDQLVELEVVKRLLYAMANTNYIDSQRNATATLHLLCTMSSTVDNVVQTCVGDQLHSSLKTNPDELYNELTPTQLEILMSHKVSSQADIQPTAVAEF